MNITIQQSDQVTERNVPASIIHCLYNLGEDPNINLSGAILLTGGSYMEELEAVQSWYQNLYITPDKAYIRFADPLVEQRVVSQMGLESGSGVTLEDCERITNISYYWFGYQSLITSFNELKYFTNLTTIGVLTFLNCGNLESISFPRSVTTVNSMAFSGCHKLKKVYITDLDAWFGILWGVESSNPFAEGRGDLYLNDLKVTDLVIPYDITSINAYAFYGCGGITSVTFHNNVSQIASGAFTNCNNLTAVHISDLNAWCNINFLSRGSNPLWCAKHLYLNGVELTGDFVIPDNITTIKRYALTDIYGITSITIPSSLTRLDGDNFTGNSDLSIYISNLENWCNFYASSLLSGSPKLYLNENLVTNLIVPDGVTELVNGTFFNLKDITTAVLPNSLTTMGALSFYGCSGLTSINIPSNVVEIGALAFYGCSSLNRIDISDLKSWTNIAFAGSSANPLLFAEHLYLNGTEVVDLVIPGTASIIKSYAFYNSKFASVNIPSSVTEIQDLAFYGSEFTSATIGATTIGLQSFSSCPNLTSLTLLNTVTTIGGSAFSSCVKLTSVTIPEGVTTLGGSAFSYCTRLQSVVLPSTITSIGSSAFFRCQSLTSVTIPEGVTTLGGSAFHLCYSLPSITLPSTITSIGNTVFDSCYALESITCNAIVPPTISNVSTFPTGVQHIYVPEESVDTYKAAPYWNAYADRIEAIPSNP